MVSVSESYAWLPVKASAVDQLSISSYTSYMGKDSLDPLMVRVRALFEQSHLTLEELGQKMGYDGSTTRASAWQFLNRTNDPRLSMLRKFAQAIGVPVGELFAHEKKTGRPK